ncbi:PAS domain S-box/diguanylate cyclase (GGDEF) domain-containing protein [Rivularia sp. PCC 7116]|uniref:CHASE2 domain-containing protein n=1 Tax=Rivularia sp. PCC 7116 TaxID=373994 RepID=UPI00029ED92F|nr:CHASE2 domain-containing protein [Rivularia sp. PCC 7116]AFY58240.1 PAS domain S-box/diguanylate cyclase (GGDEF) domain-containing protein [Rivularia sp. PCC 7116]
MGIRKKPIANLQQYIFPLQQSFFRKHRELITASIVLSCVIILRFLGLLQSLELTALDNFFQLRQVESLQERITIVAMDEKSLRNFNYWPISDSKLAELLLKIQDYQPRAIGLDIYRDLAVPPGTDKLNEVFESMPNLVGIELLPDSQNNQNSHVKAPPLLKEKDKIGINNTIQDADGKVRRGLLYAYFGKTYESFALKLALLYLKSENIVPKQAKNSQYLQLGKAKFIRFKPNDGGYVNADNGGYQFLSNFPKPACKQGCDGKPYGFRKLNVEKVLAGNVPENWIKDRIILIGYTAASLPDLKLTPYSNRFMGQELQAIPGVELQAYFTHEIISAALEGRQLMRVWSEPIEYLWIGIWAYMGAIIRWQFRSYVANFLWVLLLCSLLTGNSYLLFLNGWWIPLIPTLITYIASVVFVTAQIAHSQEEFKRSKEFLQQVINTVADPIFVKNEKHQWIVLNDAFSELIGCSKDELLDKCDYDLFPKHEADAFREKDEYVFRTQELLENEEKLTDTSNEVHFIATKRSLHRDAAGNLFLVGVTRDITKRKLLEDELKRTADELSRSNDELKLKEDRLRYIAYHDALTGLPNRKAFAEELHESLCWADNSNYLVALLFVDLDGFKQINDSLGHEMGDLLLVTVAQRLGNCLRGSDTVSRLGGDEFTIILRRIPHRQVAAKIADKILKSVTEPITLEGHSARVSASIGISIYPHTANNPEKLLKKADIAMYRAKRLGKNRHQFAE